MFEERGGGVLREGMRKGEDSLSFDKISWC